MSDTIYQSNQKKSEKFLHLFWEFPPFIQGGLGVAGEALCHALSCYENIDIVCPESSKNRASHDHSYTIYQIKTPLNGDLNSTYAGSSDEFELHTTEQMTAFAKGVKAAHFTGYNAIHSHDWITADAAKTIQIANRPNHIPVILHIHSSQVDRIGKQTNGTIFEKEKQAMQDADKIITVSDLTKLSIIDHYEIAKEKITVIPNATSYLPNTNPRPPHPPTILFAARMESQKSPIFALEIICAVLKKNPNARAIIAGKGSYLETLRDLVRFKNMESRIEVLGHIPHEKMHLVYQISDVLILPSTSEPFGLVALEAAQSGVAVILSNRCGASETLSSAPKLSLNTTESFDNWVETTMDLLSNHQLRDKQVSNQRRQLDKYSWDDAAKNLLSTLEI